MNFKAVIGHQDRSIPTINLEFVSSDRESPAQFQRRRRAVFITEQSYDIVRDLMRQIRCLRHHSVNGTETPLKKIGHMNCDIRHEAAFIFLLNEPCRSRRPADIRAGCCGAQAACMLRFADLTCRDKLRQLLVKRAETE